ncbi:MAG: substrate-binding domain-containing protein [Mangrovicoccus sp.]|nr:substrate-binding domain-containing protein [Mangrovicoccus sp.]
MTDPTPSAENSAQTGRKPTLRTIAERTGFAVATVSRALAGDPRIAKATRERVGQAAAELGYVPDRAAQRLRTGRTKVISLLLNPNHEYLGYTNELLAGITQALRGTGYAVSVMSDDVSGDRLEQVRMILHQNLADGLVFTRTELFDPRVRLLLEHGFPFATHGRTEFTQPHAFVDFDNELFARQAVQALVARGCQRVMMILPEARFTFSQHLRYGFLSAVRAAGIAYEIPEKVSLDGDPSEILAHVKARQTAPEPPDGHVCVGEVAAMATLAALADCGQRPGDGVHVVAKRASPVFDLYRPHISAQFEDIHQVGQLLGDVLLRRINGTDPATLQVICPPVGDFSAD